MRADQRREHDFYATGEPEAIRSLLARHGDVLPACGLAWEPACGEGALVGPIREAGIPDSWSADFFLGLRSRGGAIITNPPYNLINARDGHGRWLCQPSELAGGCQEFCTASEIAEIVLRRGLASFAATERGVQKFAEAAGGNAGPDYRVRRRPSERKGGRTRGARRPRAAGCASPGQGGTPITPPAVVTLSVLAAQDSAKLSHTMDRVQGPRSAELLDTLARPAQGGACGKPGAVQPLLPGLDPLRPGWQAAAMQLDTPDAIAAAFTRPEGFRFARWSVPVAPMVYGLDDASTAVQKAGIRLICDLAGHPFTEGDPASGYNHVTLHCQSWDDLAGLPLGPGIDAAGLAAGLAARNADRQLLLHFGADGGIHRALHLVRLGPALEGVPADMLALAHALMAQLDWGPQAFSGGLFAAESGGQVLRADLLALLRAAYDPRLPAASQDPALALRLAARLGPAIR